MVKMIQFNFFNWFDFWVSWTKVVKLKFKTIIWPIKEHFRNFLYSISRLRHNFGHLIDFENQKDFLGPDQNQNLGLDQDE